MSVYFLLELSTTFSVQNHKGNRRKLPSKVLNPKYTTIQPGTTADPAVAAVVVAAAAVGIVPLSHVHRQAQRRALRAARAHRVRSTRLGLGEARQKHLA